MKPRLKPKPIMDTAIIDNPDWRPERDGLRAFPRKIKAEVNLKESAVATMAARGMLDYAQVMAADRFRGIWERLGGKGAGAIDYTREPVDGGGHRDPISDGQMNAGKELNRCRQLLGARLFALVTKVCGEGQGFTELFIVKRDRLTAADNLRGALDDLATMWNYRSAIYHEKTRNRSNYPRRA